MKSILFVCLGNICRSPLAEGIAQNLAQKYEVDLHIDSAGTGHWHIGKPPCENSIRVANNNHIDISNLRARQVTPSDRERFDYVIAMDQSNLEDLKAWGFENARKIGDYGGFDGADVPDPFYYPGFEGFDKVFTMIEACVKDFFTTEGIL